MLCCRTFYFVVLSTVKLFSDNGCYVIFFVSVTQRPNAVMATSILRFLDHIQRHTTLGRTDTPHSVGLLWMSGQLVVETSI
jgi:hypothetical protein